MKNVLKKRGDFYYALNNYRKNNSEENRMVMVAARSKYKTCLRKCRYLYDKSQTNKLIDSRYKNAKIYWNMLKTCAQVKQTPISINSFERYFKSVNNPQDPFLAQMKIFYIL